MRALRFGVARVAGRVVVAQQCDHVTQFRAGVVHFARDAGPFERPRLGDSPALLSLGAVGTISQ